MDESEFACLNVELQSDEVVLSHRAFDSDPSQILIQSSEPQKVRFGLIQWLAESPNRHVKADRKQAIAKTLEISPRQVERLLTQYNENRLHESVGIERADKGDHRIHQYWQDYIRKVYEDSLKEKHPLKPADVVREVQRHAVIDLRHEEGDYPHPATVYRILKPLVEKHRRRQKIRNPGSGSWLAVETRDGKLLKADFSNQIIQCDHTKLDIRIIDGEGKLLSWRPWLTAIVDTFSSSVIGYHLWHKQPGSHEVALTLRQAILPKQFPSEYDLEKCANTYGAPLQYFFTDGGKDLSKSKLIKAIGKKLRFQCELRDRPIQGGIQERLFGTINSEVLERLSGYISKEEGGAERAEKEACLKFEDIDKMLAEFFFRDYNHQPYPKDNRETRYGRWFRGMGNKLPDQIDERDLDICLMKEDQRIVQAHGSVYFENLTYRCEELRSLKGEYVTLKYDPDHILTLYIYCQEMDDEAEKFIGYAHAINLDRQDLSLDELKQLNKLRSSAKREHSNYDTLLALDRRQKLVEQRKQEKKERQRSEQKKLRARSKKNSKVVELRKERAGDSENHSESIELLSERVALEPRNSQHSSQPTEPTVSEPRDEERHSIVIPKNQTLKRIW